MAFGTDRSRRCGSELIQFGSLIVSSILLIIPNLQDHATNKVHKQNRNHFIEYYIQQFEMVIHVILFLQ